MLEKLLCSNEEPSAPISQSTKTACQQDLEEFVHNFYTDYPNCKDFIVDFYTVTKNTGTNMDEIANDAVEIIDQENSRIEYLIERRLQPEKDKQQKRDKKKQRDNKNNCIHERSTNSTDNNTSRIDDNNENKILENSRIDNNLNEERPDELLSSSRLSQQNEKLDNDNNTVQERPSSSDSHQEQNDNSRRNDNFISSDISQILGTSDNIEIPQTQYLLNQVSHENNVVTGETINVENSLPDMDSRKLISEANKTLSNLLLDNDCHNNEISEQTDSGICTVISSENTSLYDKSPEEKKTFENEINDNGETSSGDIDNIDDIHTIIDNSTCICNDESINNNIMLDNQIQQQQQQQTSHNNNCENIEISKNIQCISSNFNGTSEEFVGLAYGNGSISVCDSNPSTFQINYSENWENLNLNIDSSESTKEFWRDLKCKNCPSTSHDINKIGNNIERYAQERISARRSKDIKNKKRHQRKFERKIGKRNYDETHRSLSCNVRRLTQSTDNSRSNSTDRYLNTRLSTFSASLHPSQNTRQMPNFGSHSPQRSPRLCHFETRNDTMRNQNYAFKNSSNTSPQNRKLLEHRRSRSEQISKMRKRDIDKREHRRNEDDSRRISIVETQEEEEQEEEDEEDEEEGGKEDEDEEELPNDGLGPRTDKSGIAPESPPANSLKKICRLDKTPNDDARRVPRKSGGLVNPAVIARTTAATTLELSTNRREDVASSSSCSSCCDSSSETSEFQSDCQDDEEIALAMQAAEIANRNQVRAKFRFVLFHFSIALPNILIVLLHF